MRSLVTARLSIAAVLSLSLSAAPPARAAAPGGSCSIPQTPRRLDRIEPRSTTSIVSQVTTESLLYTPRAGGQPERLFRCGQHYHFPIEDPQGCPGEVPSRGKVATQPPPGERVEVHTVYAKVVRHTGCDPETLDCCLEQPFVALAFQGRVTAGGLPGPIVQPPGRPLAEWSGSTTGTTLYPNDCNPAAQWSFRLGCNFPVSEAQLRQFHHVDPPRCLQPVERLSRDLTLVVPAKR